MQPASEYPLRDRVTLVVAQFRASLRTELANAPENWVAFLAPILYGALSLVFFNALYQHTKEIAGYTYGEMLLLLLCTQTTYLLANAWSIPSIETFVEDVRSGALDLQLLRPAPHLLAITTRSISMMTIIRVGLPQMLLLMLATPWASLTILPLHALAGLVLFLCAQLSLNAFHHACVLPVIWNPQTNSTEFVKGAIYDVTTRTIPLEGYPPALAVLLHVLPGILGSSLVTAVILGKVATLPALGLGISITMLLMWIRASAFRTAIRSYTSASS